jgi:hypothetical protein
MDGKLLSFKGNQYFYNYGSGGKGLVEIVGAPRVYMWAEYYYYNGDSS